MARVKKVYEDVDAAATQVTGSLIGPYRTGDEIGRGGMANVLDAVDIRTGERVALKILQSRCSGVSEVVSRFIREGRALQKMNHPNIVRVIDHGVSEGGEVWIAMERLHGATLDDLLRDEGRLPPERAIRLLLDVAKALATVHARGMVHRDIKPENIIIVDTGTPHEQAKLIDFGVAHVSDEDLGDHSIQYTRVGSVLGSAAFMAPEQLRGRETTAASDVFAAGVTLFEALTGKLPFDGETLKEQVRARDAGVLQPPSKWVKGVTFDPALVALLKRALSSDPAARPENGLALLRELNAIASRPHASSASPAGGMPSTPPISARGTLILSPSEGTQALRAGGAAPAGLPIASGMPGSDYPTARGPTSRTWTLVAGIFVGILVAVAALYALTAMHVIGR
jgi:eukaryotic-like serine/threonine-protein kinase